MNEVITIKVKKHLSEAAPRLKKLLTTNNLYIIARPGLGKTFNIDEEAKTKKVLLVEPMSSTRDGATSNLKNLKQLTTKELAKMKHLEPDQSYVVIWDTFVMMKDKMLLDTFDLIVLDESHKLLQHIDFRDVAYKVIQWFTTTEQRFIMMTGTPMGEAALFDVQPVVITADDHRELNFTVVNCENRSFVEQCLCAFANTCVESNKKTIYFSNSMRAMQDRVIAKISKKCNIGFYSSATSNTLLTNLINEKETFGDYDIVCATEYLAEGVNIKLKDDESSAILVTDEQDMTPMVLQQIANRFRETDINIYYVHNTKKDNKSEEQTLLQEAISEISLAGSFDLANIPKYLSYETNKILKKTTLKNEDGKYEVDPLKVQINDILLVNKKLTTIECFKDYFKNLHYNVNTTTWERPHALVWKKTYDVQPFISDNLGQVMDILSTISIKDKIYKKDVLMEDRRNETKIEDGKIITQNLNLFNKTMRYIKTLGSLGVSQENIVHILKRPKWLGKLSDWAESYNILSRWNATFTQNLSTLNKQVAKDHVKAQIERNMQKYVDKYPHFVQALATKESSRLDAAYKLSKILKTNLDTLASYFETPLYEYKTNSPQVDLFNINALISDIYNKNTESGQESWNENQKTAIKSRMKKCSVYKNDILLGEFSSKTEAFKKLGLDRNKFLKKNEVIINGNKYLIINK